MSDRKKYMKEWNKQYRIKNRKKELERSKQYRVDNREKENKRHKQWYEENSEYYKEYRKENRFKINEYMRIYHKNNPEQTRISHNQNRKERYKTDLKFNLNYKISNVIRVSLKNNKKGRRWEDLVGYKLNDLIKRFKKTMPKGYDWKDYLEGKLEIDHIIPKSVFNFTKPEHIDFKRCWALSNLQLLPARENLKKRAYLSKPFQPALMI